MGWWDLVIGRGGDVWERARRHARCKLGNRKAEARYKGNHLESDSGREKCGIQCGIVAVAYLSMSRYGSW
jgi:hypothetical protein